MQKVWAPRLLRDPYYNPNLSLNLPGFEIAFPPRWTGFSERSVAFWLGETPSSLGFSLTRG